MAYQWQLRFERIDDEEAVTDACKTQWEAFAVYEGKIWFKRLVNLETSDKATDADSASSIWTP